jgi:prepilin signal peptidase PulO-like enzyme (type II secretory pathway)
MALSGTDTSTAIDLARILVGMVALGVASLTDVRTRRVPNVLWYIAAGIGVGLLVVDLSQVDGSTGWHLLMAFPVAAIFAVTVTGGELWPVMPPDEEDEGRELTPEEARVYIVDLAASGVLIAASIAVLVLAVDHVGSGTDAYIYVSGSVLTIVLALGLYMTRVLHGGGDAKALMTLAVIYPVLPLQEIFPLLDGPEEMKWFPFALGVLINAAIITAFMPLAFIVLSAVRGPLVFPEAVFGYPVPIERVEEGHLWLMYEADEGATQVTRHMWPRRSATAEMARARALTLLRDRREDMVYVSPKIPFMVPLLIGLMVAIFLGNVLLALMGLLIG